VLDETTDKDVLMISQGAQINNRSGKQEGMSFTSYLGRIFSKCSVSLGAKLAANIDKRPTRIQACALKYLESVVVNYAK